MVGVRWTMESIEALALVGGYVDEELLVRNEYLAAENEILRSRLNKVSLDNRERVRLAKIAKRLSTKALEDVACIVKPDTLLKWYRQLVAQKFDGTANRGKVGRPRISPEIESLIIRFAEENSTWGYDRIQGALSNIGYSISDQSIGNVLKLNGIPPARDRKKDTTWADFIKSHQEVLVACDFFTAEVITPSGLETYYVLMFIHIASRKVYLAGATPHPNEQWMKQIARNITMEDWGFLTNCRYLIHDRDTKFCESFRAILKSSGVKPLKLPARSPNLNAYAERIILSIKSECLSKLIFFTEQSLLRAVKEYMVHYHKERNHQGNDNLLLFPSKLNQKKTDPVTRRTRLDGMLNYYYREAA